MSTRACYVFRDGGDNSPSHVVYKHHDGYPSGAVEFLAAARTTAWPLPRYEADEFGASFIAANKSGPGDVRLIGNGNWRDRAPLDIEYVYIVSPYNGAVIVEGFSVDCDWQTRKWAEPVPVLRHLLADIEHAVTSDD